MWFPIVFFVAPFLFFYWLLSRKKESNSGIVKNYDYYKSQFPETFPETEEQFNNPREEKPQQINIQINNNHLHLHVNQAEENQRH